jgi:pectate lyase
MKRTLLCVVAVISSSCITTEIFAATGFANSATGGEGGTTVTVSTAADLEYYVETNDSPNTVRVSGTINLSSVGGKVDIRSNKTITRAAPGATIIGCLDFENDANNVIIERLIITNPGVAEGHDGISVHDRITNVSINHCTIYDCGDGCIDITNASDYVTVSWCKFYYVSQPSHRNVNLIGSSDGASGDAGKLHVTFHHNWWSTLCDQRMPRVRYGQAHVYNNYYDCPGNLYCIGVGNNCNIRVENNYFNDVNAAWADYRTNGVGKIGWNDGNVFYNTIIPTWAINNYTTIFTPPYSYILSNGTDIPTIVQAYAGADSPEPPHWIDYPYGDFTRNNKVDMGDLSEFADRWLTDAADADYDGDGIVNFYEYSLLAENWLM